MKHGGLVKWVKQSLIDASSSETTLRVEKIMDPLMKGEYDAEMMETLLRAAPECVAEDKDARPTMSQAFEALLHDHDHENYH